LSRTETPKARKVVVPILVVVGAAAVVYLSNRPAISPDGQPVIMSVDQYQQVRQQVETLSKGPLLKVEAGQELSAENRASLQKSVGLVESLNGFQPNASATHVLAAKIYQALGNNVAAEERIRQAIFNGEEEIKMANTQGDKIRAQQLGPAVVEAHYMHSQLLLTQNDYEGALHQANHAVSSAPNSPDYLVARAAALIQLKRPEEALKDVNAALALDKTHKRGLQLLKLLDLASAEPTSTKTQP